MYCFKLKRNVDILVRKSRTKTLEIDYFNDCIIIQFLNIYIYIFFKKKQ